MSHTDHLLCITRNTWRRDRPAFQLLHNTRKVSRPLPLKSDPFYFLQLRAATEDKLLYLTTLRRKIAEGTLCVKVTVSNAELVSGYPDWYFSTFYPTSWQIPECASLCLDICLPNALQIIIHQSWYSTCRLSDDVNFVKQATKQKVRSLLLFAAKGAEI